MCRLALSFALLAPSVARADAAPRPIPAESQEFVADGARYQEPGDSTRLDVARLPADVIPITRDLYARGLYLEARLGVQAPGGDLRSVASPGPRLATVFGYAFLKVLAVYVDAAFSQHATHHRPPPAQTSFELVEGHLGLRLDAPFGPRLAAHVAGSGGVALSFGDVLRGLGFENAHKLGLSYGGELGLDYHVRARHHSFGLVGGARRYPGLSRDGQSYAGHGSAYLRYVF
jgi:hypothetical protein